MHDMKALLGTPGEAVPRVKADDLKKLWKMGQDLNSRNPGKQVGHGCRYAGDDLQPRCRHSRRLVPWRTARDVEYVAEKPAERTGRPSPSMDRLHRLRKNPHEMVGSRSPSSHFVLGDEHHRPAALLDGGCPASAGTSRLSSVFFSGPPNEAAPFCCQHGVP